MPPFVIGVLVVAGVFVLFLLVSMRSDGRPKEHHEHQEATPYSAPANPTIEAPQEPITKKPRFKLKHMPQVGLLIGLCVLCVLLGFFLTPKDELGRYQLDTANKVCYVIDTKTGSVWEYQSETTGDQWSGYKTTWKWVSVTPNNKPYPTELKK